MKCPRGGFVILQDDAHRHVMRTVCKTWRCEACQKRMANMYRLRMEYGSSRVRPLYITTVTYELGKRTLVNADSAVRDLRRLWQRLRLRDRWKKVAWARVTELTKKGQIHHHILTGFLEGMSRCNQSKWSRNRGYASWYRKGCSLEPQCLNHELAREWERITGDSFVVDIAKVRTIKGVADYCAKYLTKSIANYDTLEGVGFKRRFNCSRNWPSPGRLRLAGSQDSYKDSAWDEVERVSSPLITGDSRELGRRARTHNKIPCENMEQVGFDMTKPARDKKQIKQIERLLQC